MNMKIARSTPRPKVSLNNKFSIEDKDNIKQSQLSTKAEKWNRFQELKRRREEIVSKSSKKTKKENGFTVAQRN
ncbi:hypothetical protein C1645_749718 [Glomus cerebriforme]|uniref:Uncharacterized protein n=1 Tax=Glomus cerebriforme TaxID=658196 RepID=A0A397TUI4_9GLOM|nr:hypothetical protein C1645_749718 [Glomus cerebriforme]